MKPSHLPDIVAWELEKGEVMVWTGMPEPSSFVLTTTRWSQVLLGIPALVMGIVLVQVSPPLGFVFLVASGCMLGTPIWNLVRAMWTAYAITDRRLIVIERFPTHVVTSYSGDTLNNIERTDYSGGTGSLVFSRVEISVKRQDGFNHSVVERKGFFGIRDVTSVWRLIMELKNGEANKVDQQRHPTGS